VEKARPTTPRTKRNSGENLITHRKNRRGAGRKKNNHKRKDAKPLPSSQKKVQANPQLAKKNNEERSKRDTTFPTEAIEGAFGVNKMALHRSPLPPKKIAA